MMDYPEDIVGSLHQEQPQCTSNVAPESRDPDNLELVVFDRVQRW